MRTPNDHKPLVTDIQPRPQVKTVLLLAAAVAFSLLTGLESGCTFTQGLGVGPPGGTQVPDCGLPPVSTEGRARVSHTAAVVGKWSCIPPYQTPPFTPPPDDGVALSTLLEASGVSWLTGSSWMGVAAGHFCEMSQKQLAIFMNPSHQAVNNTDANSFGVLGWPTPFYIAGAGQGTFPPSNFDGGSRIADWRAVTVANLDNGATDQIIAIRHLHQSGHPDLAIGRIGPNCIGAESLIAAPAGTIATNPSNSDWVGVAVGNFDQQGGKFAGKPLIAMLRTGNGEKNTQLVLVDASTSSPQVVFQQDLDPDVKHPSTWKGLAAGNLDGGAGPDELIAVRQVSGSKSATVMVYQWNGSSFQLYATTGFGNDGNSNWTGVTVGDFNGDGRKAIVLNKNEHSKFAVFDLAPGTVVTNGIKELRKLDSSDLNSADGQNWTGITSADWLGGDQGADELIAVRSVNDSYRTNVFVYGNPFQLATRDSALEGTRAQYFQLSLISGQQSSLANIETLKQIMRDTHSNTFNWTLANQYDYTNLVAFLNATKDFGVDGQQVRVWVTLTQPKGIPGGVCNRAEDTRPTTTFNAQDFFVADFYNGQSPCLDMSTWARVMGRLAQDFPHLVGVGIDDFAFDLNFGHPGTDFTSDLIAQVQSNLRSQAPWMSFIPTMYHTIVGDGWSDLGLTMDTMLYYFRNDKQGLGPCAANTCTLENGDPISHSGHGACLAGIGLGGTIESGCAQLTLPNASGEFADVFKLLPTGRKLLGGVYFTGHSQWGTPTPTYDYDLTKQILRDSRFFGALVYTLQFLPAGHTCAAGFLTDKYCTIQKVFSADP
jgi:hypothetical protein